MTIAWLFVAWLVRSDVCGMRWSFLLVDVMTASRQVACVRTIDQEGKIISTGHGVPWICGVAETYRNSSQCPIPTFAAWWHWWLQSIVILNRMDINKYWNHQPENDASMRNTSFVFQEAPRGWMLDVCNLAILCDRLVWFFSDSDMSLDLSSSRYIHQSFLNARDWGERYHC